MYLCPGMKAVRDSPLKGGDFRTIHAASQSKWSIKLNCPIEINTKAQAKQVSE